MADVRPWLPVLLVACLGAGAGGSEDAWSGVISVDETIHGPPIQGGDQRELEHFAMAIQDRVHQARSELVKASPFMARLIREDIGFYQTELDRILAEKGGDLKVGHTVYFISGERMLVISDGARLLFNRGQVDGVVDGHLLQTRVQDPPDLDTLDDKPDGETMQGYRTKRVQRHIRDHTYDIDVAVGLPNPYRIGLLDTAQDIDLMRSLADLPGLPMAISEVSGDVQRSLHVDTVTALKVSDDIFEP
jgi:hypothetical protein